jgi:RNA polymerase sigma-70 factor (ECF subfamily)
VAQAAPTFAAVYEAYAKFVWRVLYRLGVPRSDVEDVCQEVFVVVHRRLGSFEGRSSLRTWLYGIAVRCASEYRRRAYVRRETPTESLTDASAPAPQLSSIEVQEARALLERILNLLDEEKRAVFVLYELEEVPMAEVVAIVGCPLQTGYSRLHAAREIVTKSALAIQAKECAR